MTISPSAIISMPTMTLNPSDSGGPPTSAPIIPTFRAMTDANEVAQPVNVNSPRGTTDVFPTGVSLSCFGEAVSRYRSSSGSLSSAEPAFVDTLCEGGF